MGRSPTSHTLALVWESANHCGVAWQPDPLSPCWCSPHTPGHLLSGPSFPHFCFPPWEQLPEQLAAPASPSSIHSPVSRTSPRGDLFPPNLCPQIGRMDTCKCMAESLCRPPETITTLLIGYTAMQNKKLKKKMPPDNLLIPKSSWSSWFPQPTPGFILHAYKRTHIPCTKPGQKVSRRQVCRPLLKMWLHPPSRLYMTPGQYAFHCHLPAPLPIPPPHPRDIH